ncbi:right-handed parallel beta-helix repeat-containing protein [Candidatus Thorarchaeota archaeon]|nr:MAG: right-handed parallel beta-helix repeat-containing protein [Candidatus Thorarchaeota archaeon]
MLSILTRKHINEILHDLSVKIRDGEENLRYVKYSLFLMIVTVLLVSAFLPITNPIASNEVIQPTSLTTVLSYESHDYFYIINDTDLAATAIAESWDGDGSLEFPYLIQGYEINPMIEDIHIENTRLHFKILDCNITGALGGIFLENVTNAVIQDCIFSENEYAVYLRNVTGIDVLGCSMSVPDWGQSGVYMDGAIDSSIVSCVMQGATDTDAGICGEYCDGITIYNTTIFEFDNHGIFFGGSYDIDIIDNTIYWNEGLGMDPTCGIYLVEGIFARIEGNNITENSDNGITIDGFFNVTIIDNYIFGNWIHGIAVEWADFVVIENNYIIENGDGQIGPMCGVYTYYSDYVEIVDNEFWDNAINSITLFYSDYAYIANNFVNNSYDHGMYIFNSLNATIVENEIYYSNGYGSGPECGILIEEGDFASLQYNTLGHNFENGITIIATYAGEMIGNTIFDSAFYGVYCSEVSDWYIAHNVIYDNGDAGIYLDVPTADNLLFYNDIGWCGEFLVVDEGFGNFWNYSGVGNWYSDYSGTGTYTIPGASAEVDYYPSMSLYCGVTTPYEYEAGTTGNTMTWNSSALNPGTYELLINGTLQGHVAWDGGAIAADVDGLSVGVYNVTLIAYHVSGHWLANQSILTVVDTSAPTWTVTPEDQILDYDEPLSYQIQASDPSGIASWVVNNTVNFAISSSGLLTNATFLEPGNYYVEITVTDVYSHSVSITIMITVNEPTPPAPPLDPAILMLAIGGAGVAIAIIVIVIIIKKKGS